jgi:hypothetical protein
MRTGRTGQGLCPVAGFGIVFNLQILLTPRQSHNYIFRQHAERQTADVSAGMAERERAREK